MELRGFRFGTEGEVELRDFWCGTEGVFVLNKGVFGVELRDFEG